MMTYSEWRKSFLAGIETSKGADEVRKWESYCSFWSRASAIVRNSEFPPMSLLFADEIIIVDSTTADMADCSEIKSREDKPVLDQIEHRFKDNEYHSVKEDFHQALADVRSSGQVLFVHWGPDSEAHVLFVPVSLSQSLGLVSKGKIQEDIVAWLDLYPGD